MRHNQQNRQSMLLKTYTLNLKKKSQKYNVAQNNTTNLKQIIRLTFLKLTRNWDELIQIYTFNVSISKFNPLHTFSV